SDEFTLFIAVRDIFRRPWRRTKDGVTEGGTLTAGNGNSTGIERRMTALRTLRTRPTVTRAGSQFSGCGNGSQNLTNPGRAYSRPARSPHRGPRLPAHQADTPEVGT